MTVLTLGFNPGVSRDVSIGGLTRAHKDLSTYLNSYFNKSLSPNVSTPRSSVSTFYESWVELPNLTFSSSLTIMSSLINCGWRKIFCFIVRFNYFPTSSSRKKKLCSDSSFTFHKKKWKRNQGNDVGNYLWLGPRLDKTYKVWGVLFYLHFHSSQWKSYN